MHLKYAMYLEDEEVQEAEDEFLKAEKPRRLSTCTCTGTEGERHAGG